jgi:hypothetical protein
MMQREPFKFYCNPDNVELTSLGNHIFQLALDGKDIPADSLNVKKAQLPQIEIDPNKKLVT